MERKRQGYIHELIQTEERYMDDLQLVLEVRAAADCLLLEVEGGHLCPSHLEAMGAILFCFAVLGMKPRASHKPHTRFTIELYPLSGHYFHVTDRDKSFSGLKLPLLTGKAEN